MSANHSTTTVSDLLSADDPVCLVIKAQLKPVGDTDRFQPAGFPEVGHVIYDAPRGNQTKQKVCIVDSPASMANHLETVCMQCPGDTELHDDLAGLPFVIVVTEKARIADGEVIVESTDRDVVITTTLSEGHRLASDYFVSEKQRPCVDGGQFNGQCFRDLLKGQFGVIDVPKKKGSSTYFPPSRWWDIYKTIFAFDPNSLIHGVMFAKEQIKISRLLTAHLEAFGASRVGRSGVKFDQLGKTLSGQPIFSVDEETAESIQATFIIDLGLLRSYGRKDKGLSDDQKKLLLDLALWKVKQLLARPFRYRTQCFLGCTAISVETENGPFAPESAQCPSASPSPTAESVESPAMANLLPALLKAVNIKASIDACKFGGTQPTRVYYPATDLFKAGKDNDQPAEVDADAEDTGDDDQ